MLCVQVRDPRGEPEDDRTSKNAKHIFVKGRIQGPGIPFLWSFPSVESKHREIYRGTNASLVTWCFPRTEDGQCQLLNAPGH